MAEIHVLPFHRSRGNIRAATDVVIDPQGSGTRDERMRAVRDALYRDLCRKGVPVDLAADAALTFEMAVRANIVRIAMTGSGAA